MHIRGRHSLWASEIAFASCLFARQRTDPNDSASSIGGMWVEYMIRRKISNTSGGSLASTMRSSEDSVGTGCGTENISLNTGETRDKTSLCAWNPLPQNAHSMTPASRGSAFCGNGEGYQQGMGADRLKAKCIMTQFPTSAHTSHLARHGLGDPCLSTTLLVFTGLAHLTRTPTTTRPQMRKQSQDPNGGLSEHGRTDCDSDNGKHH